jgi:hypothetical protein
VSPHYPTADEWKLPNRMAVRAVGDLGVPPPGRRAIRAPRARGRPPPTDGRRPALCGSHAGIRGVQPHLAQGADGVRRPPWQRMLAGWTFGTCTPSPPIASLRKPTGCRDGLPQDYVAFPLVKYLPVAPVHEPGCQLVDHVALVQLNGVDTDHRLGENDTSWQPRTGRRTFGLDNSWTSPLTASAPPPQDRT